jgi:hypothetical protein
VQGDLYTLMCKGRLSPRQVLGFALDIARYNSLYSGVGIFHVRNYGLGEAVARLKMGLQHVAFGIQPGPRLWMFPDMFVLLKCRGINYLHEHKDSIVHGNLSPRSVLEP